MPDPTRSDYELAAESIRRGLAEAHWRPDAIEDAISALRLAASGGWRPIGEADVGRKMLVTNNIDGRDSHGGMSHVWVGNILNASNPKLHGQYVTFDDGNMLIWDIRWCCDLPAPAGERGE